MMDSVFLGMLLNFSLLSLLAFGGMTAVLPELQRVVIDRNAWIDQRTFTDLYSMGYAMPGPNVLIGTMIGFYLAGTLGALAATLALSLPAATMTYFIAKVWHQFRESHLRRAIQRGLLPITVGLTFAGGYLVARGSNDSWLGYGLTVVTIGLVLRTTLHPLWMIGVGAILGLMGWV
ncbi:MAG: chromate transporter [Betaproteobacteria bacterium]|nr:chromate transporter [Betaproteobacteria bacterium]